MDYVKRPTQEQRILELLQQRGKEGVKVWEFMLPRPKGLGVAQYNARIYGLRKKGYVIENKEPGHFVLVDEGIAAPPPTKIEDEKKTVNCIECFEIMDFVVTYEGKDLYSCSHCGYKREEENEKPD